MNHAEQIALAFRAGQVYAMKGVSIPEAFAQAQKERETLLEWAESVKRYNAALDALIKRLEAEKKVAKPAQEGP